MPDIRIRAAMAKARAGALRHIWSSELSLDLKLRLYISGVCSIFVYGSESWILDEQACKCINGANAYMLSHITGKSKQEEATTATTSFDIIAWIRARRLKWVGHILRISDKEDRLIKKAIKHIYDNQQPGDILMDLPAHRNWKALQAFAGDRDEWRKLVRRLKEKAKRATQTQKKNKKKNRRTECTNITRSFTFHCKPLNTDTEKEEVSDDVNPFSIAAEHQRIKALKEASRSNITYSFAPRANKKMKLAKPKPRKKKRKHANDGAARAADYKRRTHGPSRNSLFYYYSKVYSAPIIKPQTVRETANTSSDNDSDNDSAEAGGCARAAISRNDAITAQHVRARTNPPRACKHEGSYYD